MPAKQKINEAEFFLEKLQGLQLLPQDLNKQTESKYYLAAFLSAAVSVLDYLLEDYNTKLSLNIPLTEKLYPEKFEEAAKRTKNQPALLFIQWWKKEKKALENDTIGELLIGKRHINTHRVQTKPDLAKIIASDSIPISDSVEVKLFRDGKLVETRRSAEQPTQNQKKAETTCDWFFVEYPNESVLTVCEKLLSKLTRLIAEAEQSFA